jgi:undecaprenyl-diphosphatase
MTDPRPGRLASVWRELDALDRAAYQSIAATPSPTIDRTLRRLSDSANRSVLWMGIAGALAIAGGSTGRRAAAQGLVAIGCTSAVTNLVAKPAMRRKRPARAEGPSVRFARMPKSQSFPSGHSASAFAFANAVAGSMPVLGLPVRSLAGAVAYSRVHTGVHYPGDVIAGSLIGAAVGDAIASIARRR